jgi:5-methylcytosine-specific restriction endonuclease McrA
MPPGWSSTRERIMKRDGYACRSCGAPAAEVHHLVPGAESDELLVALCEPCHLPISLAQAAAARAAARP